MGWSDRQDSMDKKFSTITVEQIHLITKVYTKTSTFLFPQKLAHSLIVMLKQIGRVVSTISVEAWHSHVPQGRYSAKHSCIAA